MNFISVVYGKAVSMTYGAYWKKYENDNATLGGAVIIIGFLGMKIHSSGHFCEINGMFLRCPPLSHSLKYCSKY